MAKNPAKPATYPEVYTVAEFARIFKLRQDKVLKMVREGEIPAICFGAERRIPRAVVDHYFAQATTPRQRGFGMWKGVAIDGLTYVNRLRDRDRRPAAKFLQDVTEDD